MNNQPLATFELFLLGPPRLVKDGTDQTKALKYRKGWALLGYLVTHADQWQSREKLADLLWPDLDLPAARTNLRQVLSNLSGLLTDGEGHCALERNDRAARWVAGSDVWLDLHLLSNESLAKAGSAEATARQWRIHDLQPHIKALSGPFLENVDLVGAEEYERWQQSIREFYRSRSLLLLEQASLSQQVTGHIDDAILSATQLLEMEPCDESYVLRLMDLLAEQGRKAEAVAVFERTKQAMQEQLGARPGASVVARRDALLQETREQDNVQAEVASELRWVAALYADFKNQVALDEVEDDAQRARFSETVARFGGQVFPTVGAGVFAVFGLAGVGERMAFRALLSAQDVMAWGQPLGARMGICCGKVLFRSTARGATISGDVSDLAMRICLTAEPGQVLLSAQATQQVGRAAVLSDGGEWRFRGLEGLHALSCWTESGTDQSDESARRLSESVVIKRPFCGRSEELRHLLEKWRQAMEQSARVVVVRAPAGYGKTRLLQEFARTVELAGVRCVKVDFRLETQHQPLAPFISLMHPEMVARTTDLGSKREAFMRVQHALHEIMDDGPSLLVLDDVHWSDLSSQEFLPQFFQGLEAQKALVVIATRPGLELSYTQSADVLDLGPLTDTHSRALVMAHQPTDGIGSDPARCDRIVATAGGVPLFLELLTQGQRGNPSNILSIRDVLQSELDRLGGARVVLRSAAVIGIRFSSTMLAFLMGSEGLHEALLRAQALQLIQHEADESYCFRHALIYDAVYESVPLGDRKRLHRQLAENLQSRPGSPLEEIAHHWEASQDWIQAAIGWRKAGDTALQHEFAVDAVASFQRALHLLGRVEVALRPVQLFREAQLRLGYALHMAEGFGSPTAWRLFKDVAEDLETQDLTDSQNHDFLFAALSGCYMGGSSQGELDGYPIAQRLQHIARTPAQMLMASFALGNSLFWCGDFVGAIRWQTQGIALSQSLPVVDRVRYCIDDPAVICRAFLAWSLWFQGHDEKACAMARETRELANQGKRSHEQCFGFTLLLGLYWCQRNTEELISLATQTLLLARQYGFALWEGASGLFLLCAQAHSGSMADPAGLFAAARQMQIAYQAGITTSRWITADALVELGEWKLALELLEVSIAEADFHEDQYCVADLLWLRGRCQAATGHSADSAESFARARVVANRLGAHGLLARYEGALDIKPLS